MDVARSVLVTLVAPMLCFSAFFGSTFGAQATINFAGERPSGSVGQHTIRNVYVHKHDIASWV